jgi:hypothetical protein
LDGILTFLATLPVPPGPRGTVVYDLAQPNPVYFARADAIVQLAAQYGFLVLTRPSRSDGEISDSEISVLIPTAAVTGRVSVTTPGGTATSPSDFVVTLAIF